MSRTLTRDVLDAHSATRAAAERLRAALETLEHTADDTVALERELATHLDAALYECARATGAIAAVRSAAWRNANDTLFPGVR
jgi:hydroxypyruvate isomerase